MSWKADISLRNKTAEDVFCVIPKGQIFENKQVGTSVQNVAADRDYRLIIPASSQLIVEIDVLCINRSFSPPCGLAGSISIYKVADDFKDQHELWKALASSP